MIRVQYFARYREVLGIDGEQLQRAALSNLEPVSYTHLTLPTILLV